MDLNKWLSKLEEDVSSFMNAPVEQVFTESFMVQHTRFENIYEFYNTYKLAVEQDESPPLIDEFVIDTTDFSSWLSMQEAAISFRRDEDGL
jgi:hypothetical protein